jgi:hypothetical protein
MFKSLSLSLVLTLAAAAAPALAADPTPHQVYEAARSGHLTEAQQMINQVLRDHPQSGEAHYVAAEVNARMGNLALARQELNTARQLEPGLPFANPNAVQALERRLQGGAMSYSTGTERPSRSFPWGWLLLLLGGLGLLWSVIRRRAQQQSVFRPYPDGPAPSTAYRPNAPGYGPGAPGYGPGGPGYPPGGTGMPGAGSGVMGGLATGLAAGAGLAAGEELIHRLGDRPEGGVIPNAGASEPEPDPNNPGMGGQDFGVDDGSSWDDGSSGGEDPGGGGGDDWT